jgi:hypothetical protein
VRCMPADKIELRMHCQRRELCDRRVTLSHPNIGGRNLLVASLSSRSTCFLSFEPLYGCTDSYASNEDLYPATVEDAQMQCTDAN